MKAVGLARLCRVPCRRPIRDRRSGFLEPTALRGRLSLRAARQHFCRRGRLREGARTQSRIHRASRPFYLFGLGIDLQKLAMSVECRRLAELKREVEPLTKE